MNADDDVAYLVVMNHEEQYSVWPAQRATPPGWRGTGFDGSRAECLENIETVWTDMRMPPRSLRERHAGPAPS